MRGEHLGRIRLSKESLGLWTDSTGEGGLNKDTATKAYPVKHRVDLLLWQPMIDEIYETDVPERLKHGICYLLLGRPIQERAEVEDWDTLRVSELNARHDALSESRQGEA